MGLAAAVVARARSSPTSTPAERALVVLLLAAAIAVGPVVASLELRLRTARNPLFHAALAAVESAPDRRPSRGSRTAARSDPEDRDLAYLLGAARRRAGRYEEAAELYRQMLAADPTDAVARNNLANIEFVRGSYDAARARYRAGHRGRAPPEIAATSYYNLSLAYLQKFEYQAYNEAKSQRGPARSRAGGRLRPCGSTTRATTRWWTSASTREQVRDKFAGSESGVAVRNIAAGQRRAAAAGTRVGSLANRFVGVRGGLRRWPSFLVGRWRGPKAFTLHCGRCGTAFCRYCHLGQVSGGPLLAVLPPLRGAGRGVRPGAQPEDGSRCRRRTSGGSACSGSSRSLSPGAGQVYGGWTLRGARAPPGLVRRPGADRGRDGSCPFTEVSRRLSPPWLGGRWPGSALVGVWLAANRFRPESDVELPARPAGPRRARAAQAAG